MLHQTLLISLKALVLSVIQEKNLNVETLTVFINKVFDLH